MHPDVWKTRWKLMVGKFQKTVKSSEPKNADFLYANGHTTYMMLSLVSKETILTLLDFDIYSYKMNSISDDFTPCKGIQIPESAKFLPLDSGILDFRIRNSAQGVQNPDNDWNPKSSTWYLEFIAWNLESLTVFDYLSCRKIITSTSPPDHLKSKDTLNQGHAKPASVRYATNADRILEDWYHILSHTSFNWICCEQRIHLYKYNFVLVT